MHGDNERHLNNKVNLREDCILPYTVIKRSRKDRKGVTERSREREKESEGKRKRRRNRWKKREKTG